MKNTKKTVDKRQKDIQKKLSAAVLMLLVSSIMMVSSTYAWFTLSTAPEVTGIQTTIGGNGNLEIALASYNEDTGEILAPTSSAANDSIDYTNDITVSNTKWGNLVSLSTETQQDPYGLGTIKLYPAKLNDAGNGKVNSTSLLQTPTYGADGRVNELASNVSSGVYDTATKFFKTSGYGVRGLGVQSSKTERQFAYTGALASINGNMSSAEAAVESAISSNGKKLTDIAIAYGLNQTEFTEEDINAMGNLISQTQAALPYIESSITSIINSMLASAYGQKSAAEGGLGIDDATYLLLADTITSLDVDDTSKVSVSGNNITVNLGTDANTYTINDVTGGLAAAIANYQSVSANLKAAAEQVETVLASTEYTLNNIQTILNYIMKISTAVDNKQVTVEGFTINEIQEKPMNYAVDLAAALKGSGLDIKLNQDSGAFYDIATLIGSISSRFTANISVEYQGIAVDVENGLIIIASEPTSAPLLSTLQTAALALGEPQSGAAGTTSQIDDLYAFALDLYFRTNASESNLLLQTEASNRIYEDSTNTSTMGSGSTMNFTFDESLTESMVKNLMKSIKVVFISGDEGKKDVILATALLDANNAKIDGYSVSANMYLRKQDGTLDTEGTTALLELTQNKAHQVTVLVYLDGETITNSDVATAAASLTGTMNLQFASDAELTPMEYTEFMQGDVKAVNILLDDMSLSVSGMDSALYDFYLYYAGSVNTTENRVLVSDSTMDLTSILSSYTTAGETVTLKVKTFEKGANPASGKALATSSEVTYTVPTGA